MRYIALGIGMTGWALYAQCNMCTPDGNLSPRPYGFNPSILYVRPGVDTSLTIYFTFPDTVRQGTFLLSPNYAIWVDSLRLDSGRITQQNGQPFAYNTSNPSQGPIHFDQMHRYKQYDINDPSKKANFVVYQNPGTTQGQTPPFGCARVCVRGTSNQGSDTLRVKVRAFIPNLGDGANKDTTNLTPQLLGQNAWLDTVFRYVVVVTANPPAAHLGSHSAISSFSIRPNPAVREATISFQLLRPTPLTLRAYTADGREVYRSTSMYTCLLYTS
ncbi:MAG: hypothetical protein N2170_09535, partial [Bacteroidia bacterium]|nr:hypothetical protein [Bacteroidia bacterium]